MAQDVAIEDFTLVGGELCRATVLGRLLIRLRVHSLGWIRQRQREVFDGQAFNSNQREECAQNGKEIGQIRLPDCRPGACDGAAVGTPHRSCGKAG